MATRGFKPAPGGGGMGVPAAATYRPGDAETDDANDAGEAGPPGASAGADPGREL